MMDVERKELLTAEEEEVMERRAKMRTVEKEGDVDTGGGRRSRRGWRIFN